DCDGQAHVAMVEERIELKHGFVEGESPDWPADQYDLHRPERGRKTDLHEVETHGRGDIEVGIAVMSVMEPPQYRPGVIRPMPVVEREIGEQKDCDRLNERDFRKHRRQSPVAL